MGAFSGNHIEHVEAQLLASELGRRIGGGPATAARSLFERALSEELCPPGGSDSAAAIVAADKLADPNTTAALSSIVEVLRVRDRLLLGIEDKRALLRLCEAKGAKVCKSPEGATPVAASLRVTEAQLTQILSETPLPEEHSVMQQVAGHLQQLVAQL